MPTGDTVRLDADTPLDALGEGRTVRHVIEM